MLFIFLIICPALLIQSFIVVIKAFSAKYKTKEIVKVSAIIPIVTLSFGLLAVIPCGLTNSDSVLFLFLLFLSSFTAIFCLVFSYGS